MVGDLEVSKVELVVGGGFGWWEFGGGGGDLWISLRILSKRKISWGIMKVNLFYDDKMWVDG